MGEIEVFNMIRKSYKRFIYLYQRLVYKIRNIFIIDQYDWIQLLNEDSWSISRVEAFI